MNCRQGYVYFAKPVGQSGPIKIGFSKSPQSRIQDLLLWSPIDLELICVVSGEAWWERRAHCYFAESHWRSEWFHSSQKLINAIERLRNGGPFLEVVPESNTPHPQSALCNPKRRRTIAQREHMSVAQLMWRRVGHGGGRGIPEFEEYWEFCRKHGTRTLMPPRLKAKIFGLLNAAE